MAAALHLLLLVAFVGGPFIRGAVSQENQPGCPEGWSQLGSRCFIYQNTPSDMMAAERNCQGIGGHLASIHSEEENWFLSQLVHLHAKAYRRTWIGLHDAVKEGEWMWTDGSDVDFVKWYKHEPNNAGGEDCTENNFSENYWNDIPCDHKKPYLCSRDL